ncbi:MAG: SIR2 family protein [Bryobacterales bacterium]|nr:SIR2 family protein [Bryobacterales bacterium]
MRSRKFAIVKLHGSADDVESIRLTRTHYRDSTLASPELNECLKSLLTWKTLLFVGYSLRDSDLMYLFDEARLRFGKKFGPHYAIMPHHEADAKFSSYLKEAFSIEVIGYEFVDSDDATRKVAGILRDLSGQVARVRYEMGGFVPTDPSATRPQAAYAALARAVQLTGSYRGEVCLVTDDTDPRLQRVAIYPNTKASLSLPQIDHDSVIGTVFLQAKSDVNNDYIYLPEVLDARTHLDNAGHFGAKYVLCDPDVESELAYPIIADGRRVGTLNLEANTHDAYTAAHISVAKSLSGELGQVYIQSERRRMRSVPLAGSIGNPIRFNQL